MTSLLEGFIDVGHSFGRMCRSPAFHGLLLILLCFTVPAGIIFTYALHYDVVLQLSRPKGLGCREIPQALMLVAMLMVVFFCIVFVLTVGEYVSALRWKGVSHRSYRAHYRMSVYYCLALPLLSLGPIMIMARYC